MPTNTRHARSTCRPPIAAYFAADTSDATRGFVFHRERRRRSTSVASTDGRQAIGRWKAEATAKYHYTSEPLAVDCSGADVTVIARVTGEFPGSPIELRYRFTLEGDKIARLEITG